jgi:accessory gene regulator protein AgrB
METQERARLRKPPLASPRAKRRFGGGATGNDRLTSAVGAVLIVLLAIEGATIPFLRSLLTVHIFVGMLLLGPVALKLGSTGYRFLRYYGREPEYVRRGPPSLPMRFFVAPVLVLSTLTLFGTGVGLIVVGPGRGALLLLHKASFVVWVVVMSIHVLTYAIRAARHAFADFGRQRVAGVALRHMLVLGALAAGLLVAILTLPVAEQWHRFH